MSREIFVDTSAWIAISNVSDKYHPAAKEVYNQLIGDQRTFVTTNLVVAETYIIIRRTGGHPQAMRLLKSLRGSPRLRRVWSDADLESLAEDVLEKYTDQDFSYTDAVSFVVMKERGIEQALTFDNHFAFLGFQLLPVMSA
jgi:uncharacterized protein